MRASLFSPLSYTHARHKLPQAICEARGGEYGLACEHAHSCCILLARSSKFKGADGRWNTWIDYDRRARLAGRLAAGGREPIL